MSSDLQFLRCSFWALFNMVDPQEVLPAESYKDLVGKFYGVVDSTTTDVPSRSPPVLGGDGSDDPSDAASVALSDKSNLLADMLVLVSQRGYLMKVSDSDARLVDRRRGDRHQLVLLKRPRVLAV